MTDEKISALLTTDFFSKISHHSRSPFNGLLGFAELLLINQHKIGTEDAREYILRINMLSKRAYISSENNVVLLKIISGNIKPVDSSFPFSSVIDHISNINKEGLILKKIDFKPEVEIGLTINKDPFLMNLIFANILSRAVKLCNEESEISMLAKTTKNKKIISLNYQGMPIESDIVGKYFSSQSKESELFPPELDIELWICHKLLLLQGSKLVINYTEKLGTTFVVEF